MMQQKTTTDFSKASLDDLNQLSLEDVAHLKEDEFRAYYHRSCELGNLYMFHGVIQQPADIRYGTSIKTLAKDGQGEWIVGQSAGLLPQFEHNPLMIDKEKFSDEMTKLGVPKMTLEKFFDFVADFEDF